MKEEKGLRGVPGAEEMSQAAWEMTPEGMLQEKRMERPALPEEPEMPEEPTEPETAEGSEATAEDEDDAEIWNSLPKPARRRQPKVKATIVASDKTEKSAAEPGQQRESSDGIIKKSTSRRKKKTKGAEEKKSGVQKIQALDLRLLLVILIVLIVIALVFGAILLQQNSVAQSAMAKADSGFNQGDGKSGDDAWDYSGTSESKSKQSLDRYDGDSSGVTMKLKSKQGHSVLSYEALYEKCAPSAVSITVENKESSGSGTGIVLTEDGYIITCAHVIEDQTKATITTSDGKEYKAQLVGSDAQTDLALLKIDASGLTPAEFGDADELTVGDEALAIGDPLGATFRGTLTNGIISAINRDVILNGYAMNLIQTTAALNSGNSGGPLLNLYGQVVGINNMKMVSSSTTVEGLGFAVPTTTAKEIVEALAKDGGISRPVLGITCYGVDEGAAKKNDSKAGLVVASVKKASDCADKGIQTGDLITAIDGKTFTSVTDFKEYAASFEIGKELTLTVYRPKVAAKDEAESDSDKSLIKAADYVSIGEIKVAMIDQQDLS